MIHTVGPIYRGGNDREAELLASAYRNSMQLALEKGIRRIAFPAVSTGRYGYPVEEAAKIAVGTVRDFYEEHEDDFDLVRFVLFEDWVKDLFEKAYRAC